MGRDLPSFLIPGQQQTALTLDEVYSGVLGCYQSSIDWYMSEKKAKSRNSKAIRLTALVLAVLGGLVPVLTHFTDIDPNVGYLLLAIAGGLLLIDKYFGFSDSWSRYVRAGITLNAELLNLQTKFSAARHAQDLDLAWQLVQGAAAGLASVVGSETDTWSGTFDAALEDQRQSSTGPAK